MKRVRITKLDPSVRAFLSLAKKGSGLLVEDTKGRQRYRVLPAVVVTPAAKQRAWRDVQALQRKVGRAMKEAGVTEYDIDRALQDRS